MQIKQRFLELFQRTIDIVFATMLVFITLGLVVGVVRLFLNLGSILTTKAITGSYLPIVSDVLTLFVLVELSRSLVEYFDENRLRLTFIVDAGIVFVLREIMIKLFEHKLSVEETLALSALLLVLGALRVASVLLFQREKRIVDALQHPRPTRDASAASSSDP